jgi:1-acyl-sn-glycerol-3-phosphate acyltransferase
MITTSTSAGKEVLKIRLINDLVRISQFLSWIILFPTLNLLFNIEVKGRSNLESQSPPFIIAANHFSYYDSFMFRIILGLFTRNLPLRFMAVREFNSIPLNILYRIGLIPFIYLIFGVFTVTPGAGLKQNLETATDILKNGGNVLIFPEGQINSRGIGTLRKGAVVLSKLTNCTLVPVVFVPGKKRLFRRTIKINIGEPLLQNLVFSAEEGTQILRTKMIKLYEEI